MKKIYILLSFCLIQFIAQAQTIPSYVPTNGLVGWWPFNGNANDESGNGNHVTVNGATLTTDRNGNPNSAYNFDGNAQYLNSGIIQTSFTQKSFSAWIKLNTLNQSGGGIVSIQTPNGMNFDAIVYNELGNGWFMGSDGTSRSSTSGIIETQISWINIVITYENYNYKMYRNGILVHTSNQFSLMPFTANNCMFLIGLRHYWPSNGYINATLDDIAIYNRALTQQEITDLYQAQACSLSISSQPTNQSSTTGSNASFNVGVTATYCNNPTTYQWQTNTGFGWQTLQLAGQYTGVNTSTLHVSNVGSTNTNQLFRCLIQSGNIADTTQTATLSVVNTGNTTQSAVTHAIPYQAVVRDGAGNPLINHPLTVRCTLHDNTASGTSIYQETHTITTNNLGLFTLHIGTGVASIGNIDSIHWALYKKYLQVEFDTTAQGVSYIDLGTQQLMAVPYALYAETAGNALNAPKGDDGVDGVNGVNGVNGVDGATGPAGPQGLQGIQGPQGVAGNNGGLTFITPINLYELYTSYWNSTLTQSITVDFDSILNVHAVALLLYYEYDCFNNPGNSPSSVEISTNNNMICKDIHGVATYSNINFSMNKQYILKNTVDGIITFSNALISSHLKLKVVGYYQ